MNTTVERLADVLAQENRALAALDLRGAAALLAEKSAALSALAGTYAGEAEMHRLRGLAAENRALLERAMGIQTRVIGLLVRAAREQARPAGRGYGRGGAPCDPPWAPLSMSAQA